MWETTNSIYGELEKYVVSIFLYIKHDLYDINGVNVVF